MSEKRKKRKSVKQIARQKILMAGALAVLLFCSCGNTQTADAPVEPTEDEQQTAVTDIEEPASDTTEERQTATVAEKSEEEREQPENTTTAKPPENDTDFVLAEDYIPHVFVDLKYATTDNFTGTVIYESDCAYLRYGTAKKLAAVAGELERDGYALKIWDAYRPVEAQRRLWEVCPDSRYVANPNTGFSSHSKGNTVDITLVTLDGKEVDMPTGFDDFSARADRDYSDCEENEAQNAKYLEELMITYGFKPYQGEWWHYSDAVDYSVEENAMTP